MKPNGSSQVCRNVVKKKDQTWKKHLNCFVLFDVEVNYNTTIFGAQKKGKKNLLNLA